MEGGWVDEWMVFGWMVDGRWVDWLRLPATPSSLRAPLWSEVGAASATASATSRHESLSPGTKNRLWAALKPGQGPAWGCISFCSHLGQGESLLHYVSCLQVQDHASPRALASSPRSR